MNLIASSLKGTAQTCKEKRIPERADGGASRRGTTRRRHDDTTKSLVSLFERPRAIGGAALSRGYQAYGSGKRKRPIDARGVCVSRIHTPDYAGRRPARRQSPELLIFTTVASC
jgi:hypothetical protein